MTLFLKVKIILAVFFECCSNWLRLITLCENITLNWSCGPDCIRLTCTYISGLIYYANGKGSDQTARMHWLH